MTGQVKVGGKRLNLRLVRSTSLSGSYELYDRSTYSGGPVPQRTAEAWEQEDRANLHLSQRLRVNHRMKCPLRAVQKIWGRDTRC